MRRIACLTSHTHIAAQPLRMSSTSTAAIVAAATNPTDKVLSQLLQRQYIAVVGISNDESKPSHHVATMLYHHGQYDIIPVRPGNGVILNENIIPHLRLVPKELVPKLLVNVFRKPEDTEQIVDEAISIGATAMWFQLGVVNEKAIVKAVSAGMTVVADKCLWIEYCRLGR